MTGRYVSAAVTLHESPLMRDTPPEQDLAVDQLPHLIELIEGFVADAGEDERKLRQADLQPQDLTHASLDRIEHAYGVAHAVIDQARQQVRRWRKTSGAVGHARELAHLERQIRDARRRVATLLALVDQTRGSIGDPRKDELERVVDAFLGSWPRT